jgi:hypothetical protein
MGEEDKHAERNGLQLSSGAVRSVGSTSDRNLLIRIIVFAGLRLMQPMVLDAED